MTEPESRSLSRADWLLLGLLLLLVLPLRLWLLHNTEVTARDSIGYIRFALRFEQEDWREVLKTSDQHPGFPVLVWAASVPVRWLDDGATTAENMQLSTQIVSFVAALLLILPSYLLGRQFFDRRVSFCAALLYQYLPIGAQHLSDGISESAFLVLLTGALLQSVHAVRQRSAMRCVWCGLLAGVSYLIRPEGMLILPAFVLVLIVLQYRPDTRCSWKRFFACGGSTVLAAALIASVYVSATGRISNKRSSNETIKNLLRWFTAAPAAQEAALIPNRPMPLFAAAFRKIDNKALLLQRSVRALVTEIVQGFHYVAFLPALLGLWWSFGRLRRDPGFWVLTIFCVIHGFILVSLAMSVYYVSDRHVMILVLLGCYFVVSGLQEFSYRVFAWFRRGGGSAESLAAPRLNGGRWASLGFAILLVGLFAFCLPKATQRLHGNRAGNHLAGQWLSAHLHEGDVVEDDHSWSHYYSGLVFQESVVPVFPEDLKANCYVVITRSRDAEVDAQRQKKVLVKEARPVYAWPDSGDVENARVVVYFQPRDPRTHPWHTTREGTH